MSKKRFVIPVSIALYMLALAIAWVICTRQAMRNTERMLAVSEAVFSETIDDSVSALLAHTVKVIRDSIGPTARALSTEEAALIAERQNIDEINIISNNGDVICSTDPKVLGSSFRTHPKLEEFMSLTNSPRRIISQPFRHGIDNPEVFCKYTGLGFDDGSGFIQIGFNYERLVIALDRYDKNYFRNWTLGRSGHYDFANADYLPVSFPDGEVFKGHENGKSIYYRAFEYGSHRYVSVLPEQEYFGARNTSFAILAPVLAVIILFLLVFVNSLVRAENAEAQQRAAEDAARARDLDLARAIQLSCMAPVGPFRRDVMSLSFDVITKPAKEVGGDFYDFYFLDSSHLAFVMADVAGKGISAAMFMMMAKNEIFNAMNELKNPVNAITEANLRICENNDASMFVTAWVGVIDIFSGKIVYVNAGHNRPFIRRADGTVVKECGRGGRFLGMFPDAKFQSHQIDLHPGDALFLYTDGVTEAMNYAHKLYGEKHLTEVLSRTDANPRAIVTTVNTDVAAFAGETEQSDDLTALALVWHGVPQKYEREFKTSPESTGGAINWLKDQIGLADKSARSRLLNAADEIITNIVSYSKSTRFLISVENAPGRTRLQISDDGAEYNQLAHEEPNVNIPLEDRPIGGLGILMVKRLVDSAAYRRESGRNILTLLVSAR